MGAAASALASCLGSCLASCACSFVQNACSSVGRRGSLLPYFILLFVTTVMAFILRYWGGPLVVDLTVTSLTLCSSTSSLPCYGFGALTRISWSLTLFFLLHLALPLISRWSWWLKAAILTAVVVGCWFIPDPFYTVYVDVARFFSGLFLLLQLVILVDFAYAWQEGWTTDERPWHKAVLGVSAAMLIGCVVLLVYLFQWFSSPSCQLETFFISFTLILTTGTTLLSVSPWIEGGGLLPAALVTLYSFYLLFSALSSDPSSCNGLYGPGGSSSNAKANVWQMVVNLTISAFAIAYSAYNVYQEGSLIGEGQLDTEQPSSEAYSALAEKKEDDPPAHDVEAAAGRPAAAAPASSAPGEVEAVSDKQYRRFYLVMGVASMYVHPTPHRCRPRSSQPPALTSRAALSVPSFPGTSACC